MQKFDFFLCSLNFGTVSSALRETRVLSTDIVTSDPPFSVEEQECRFHRHLCMRSISPGWFFVQVKPQRAPRKPSARAIVDSDDSDSDSDDSDAQVRDAVPEYGICGIDSLLRFLLGFFCFRLTERSYF